MHRVEQRKYKKGDCGVACVAMITGQSYNKIHDVFESLGLIRSGNYYTYHKDLIDVMHLLGYEVKRRKFISWADVQAPAIVKVNVRTGNFWHWVVLADSRILLDPKPGSPDSITDFRGRRGQGQYLFVYRKSDVALKARRSI